jgi:formylglycine-generating enzyme required for sulfatase activity
MRDLPVTYVTVDDAVAYARWTGGFLPSSHEWEWAARGEEGNVYPWGNFFEPWRCNTADVRLGRPSSPEEFEGGQTRLGFRDMCGNVSEMTRSEDRRDAVEMRGASFTHSCSLWGLTFVYKYEDPGAANHWRGFRIARR